MPTKKMKTRNEIPPAQGDDPQMKGPNQTMRSMKMRVRAMPVWIRVQSEGATNGRKEGVRVIARKYRKTTARIERNVFAKEMPFAKQPVHGSWGGARAQVPVPARKRTILGDDAPSMGETGRGAPFQSWDQTC
jgi:hypothetical protein